MRLFIFIGNAAMTNPKPALQFRFSIKLFPKYFLWKITKRLLSRKHLGGCRQFWASQFVWICSLATVLFSHFEWFRFIDVKTIDKKWIMFHWNISSRVCGCVCVCMDLWALLHLFLCCDGMAPERRRNKKNQLTLAENSQWFVIPSKSVKLLDYCRLFT